MKKYYTKSKKKRNILQTIIRRMVNWTGHILCRNCLLEHIIEGKVEGRMEVMGRRGRKRKQLLADHEEKRKLLETERGSAGSHRSENWRWKRLRT